jgi:hypothetical protein
LKTISKVSERLDRIKGIKRGRFFKEGETPMTANDLLLTALFANVCGPILAEARPQLTAEQLEALTAAALVIVCTDPARVAVLGFDRRAGAVDCGRFEVPRDGGLAVARFLELGLQQLTPAARAKVGAVLQAGEGQLVASLRPDRGRAEAYLIARFDRFDPVSLFTLQATVDGMTH